MLLWNHAGTDPVRAAEALIKLEAREARLLGLDMPTKVAMTDPDGGIPLETIRRVMERVARRMVDFTPEPPPLPLSTIRDNSLLTRCRRADRRPTRAGRCESCATGMRLAQGKPTERPRSDTRRRRGKLGSEPDARKNHQTPAHRDRSPRAGRRRRPDLLHRGQVHALQRAVPHSRDLELREEALRLGRELLRGTKYEEER